MPDSAQHGTALRWHALSAAAVLEVLESSTAGLLPEEVAVRHARYGLNELPRPSPRGLTTLYLRQFMSPLIYLLLAAAAVSLALGEIVDAGFIFAVLQINAVIGAAQEWKAESSARALDQLIQNWSIVIRDGEHERISTEDLVPGDIVLTEPGMRVGADIRLLESSNLRVDESLLTGESLPVEKDASARLGEDTVLGDRINMLHVGTLVVGGQARGVVVETGENTQIGRIASVLTRAGSEPPLVTRIKRFTNVITIAFAGVIMVVAVAEFLRGTPIQDIFFIAVALAVAAVPEGLPVAITVALAIGTTRMAARKVVVRLLPAVEGLGACTLIASDKTGTLTCNELTAKRIWLPDGTDVEITGAGYQIEGEALVANHSPAEAQRDALKALAVSGALCNEAGLHVTAGRLQHYGDTVDVAFLVLARKLGLDPALLSTRHAELARIPFRAEHRYAASFNRDHDTLIAHVKGAVEVLLPRCEHVDHAAVVAAEDRLAEAGYRVLGVAAGEVHMSTQNSKFDAAMAKGLHFLGLVGFIDPLRPEARTAVQQCAAAGVMVRMVTGDHPATALSIAQELGIVGEDEDAEGLVVTGAELMRLAGDQESLDLICDRARIFARVEPMQKLQIVEALQKIGHFVAVTGDGVNDAPALKRANIGVAMGTSGTDVARAAADLILTDDQFASIVNGMREGRIAYDNVRKVVYLLIGTGVAEVVLFLLAILAGLPMPLFAVQLLWLNLVTNGIQDVALAFEKGEPDVLKRPPRPPGQHIIDRPMIIQVMLSGGYGGLAGFLFYAWLLGAGGGESEARNMVLLFMVLFENVHVFNCRSETRSAFKLPLGDNPFLMLSVVAALGLHVASMYIPFMQNLLRVQPVSFEGWVITAQMALGLLAVVEVLKWLQRRRAR